jgi:hypothetical protein
VVDEDASRTNLLDEEKANGSACSEGSKINKRLCEGENFVEGSVAVLNNAKGESFPIDDQNVSGFKPFKENKLANEEPLHGFRAHGPKQTKYSAKDDAFNGR